MANPRCSGALALIANLDQLSLQYGCENIFKGVQVLVCQLFRSIIRANEPRLKNAHFIIWIDNFPIQHRIERPLYGGSQYSTHWRFHLTGTVDSIEGVAERLAEVIAESVGWRYIGRESHIPSEAMPLFEYKDGMTSVFFLRCRTRGGESRTGYIDIDHEGKSWNLVFIEMEDVVGKSLKISELSQEEMTFTVKLLQDVSGELDSLVVLNSSDETEQDQHLGSRDETPHILIRLNVHLWNMLRLKSNPDKP